MQQRLFKVNVTGYCIKKRKDINNICWQIPFCFKKNIAELLNVSQRNKVFHSMKH